MLLEHSTPNPPGEFNKNIYSRLLGLYERVGFKDRIYLPMRLFVAGYDKILPLIPNKGSVLDLGCGYGLLSNLISLTKPQTTVLGVDSDEKRIKTATLTLGDRKNIRFEVGLAQELQQNEHFDTVVCCDVLHHIVEEDQILILRKLSELLFTNDVLILKEIDRKPLFKYYINCAHDSLFTGPPLYFRDRREWENILNGFGWRCQSTLFGRVYPHVLIKAIKL